MRARDAYGKPNFCSFYHSHVLHMIVRQTYANALRQAPLGKSIKVFRFGTSERCENALTASVSESVAIGAEPD